MSDQRGSALLLVLVLCCSAALLVATWAVVGTVEADTLVSERDGRARLHAAEEALARLAEQAWVAWVPGIYALEPGYEGILEVEPSSDAILHASVRSRGEVPPLQLSADLERGKDGIEIPRCALAASTVSWQAGRGVPIVELPAGSKAVEVAVGGEGLPLELAPGGVVAPDWSLDEGTQKALEREASRGGPISVVVLSGRPGLTIALPAGPLGRSGEEPAAVLLTGGGTLDLTGAGDLYGVFLAPEGDVLLEGAVVHGAVLVGGRVEAGMSGRVAYSDDIRSWARYDLLTRVRLVPGTRRE